MAGSDEVRQMVEIVLKEKRRQTLKMVLLVSLICLLFLFGLILILKPELVVTVVKATLDLFTRVQECKSGCPT